jgi:hypothetical protein
MEINRVIGMKKLIIGVLILFCCNYIQGQASGMFATASSSSTSVQNLLLYSEQIDNAAWDNSNTTITANAGNDLSGNTTMDRITLSSAWGGSSQGITGLTASTSYVLSFDATRGSSGSSAEYVIYDTSNGWATIANDSYYSSTSTSPVRISVPFTTPSGCTAIAVVPYSGSATGDNFLIGRVQVSVPDKDYVTTTSSKVE